MLRGRRFIDKIQLHAAYIGLVSDGLRMQFHDDRKTDCRRCCCCFFLAAGDPGFYCWNSTQQENCFDSYSVSKVRPRLRASSMMVRILLPRFTLLLRGRPRALAFHRCREGCRHSATSA